MKVLLNNPILTPLEAFKRTVFVMLFTNVLGSLGVCLYTNILWINALTLSSVFSSPLLIIGIPVFYLVHAIRKKSYRIALAILSVLTLSAALYVLLLCGHWGDSTELALLMAPYVVAAEVSFLVVCRHYIFRNDDSVIQTSESL